MGPLILFFFANARSASSSRPRCSWWRSSSSLGVSYALTRHLPVMAMVTAVIVVVFGGLTLVLHDETFIKMKPTIIYMLFGGCCSAGCVQQAAARGAGGASARRTRAR